MKTTRHDGPSTDDGDQPPVWTHESEPPAFEPDFPLPGPDEPAATEEPGYGHGV